MSLLQYFKPRDGLPDPWGHLSNSVGSNAIAMEVEKIAKMKKKRGQYRRCGFVFC